MTVETYVDAEGAAKAWAKANTPIAAVVGARVFLAPNNAASFPQLVVSRVGGAPDTSEAVIDAPVITFGCWAASRRAASDLAYVVATQAQAFRSPTAMGTGTEGMGARVLLGPLFVTDEADELAGRFRYVLDIEFVIRAT